MTTERLQKLMAHAGLGSRRHNETLIRAGKVTVNGRVARLGDRGDLRKDDIRVDGKQLKIERKRYIMVNKPRDVISSTEDELGEGRKTVRDLVDIPGHLYPIGRLDKNSVGLILMTNDGDLAHQLTHPRYEHDKTYLVWVEGKPSVSTLQKWSRGVMLDDKMTLRCQVKVVQQESKRTHLKIVMREGRKRQIRKVAELLGHNVRHLERIKIGNVRLKGVDLGEWRDLSPKEILHLKRLVEKKTFRRERADRKQRRSLAKGRSKPFRNKSNKTRRKH